MAVNFYRRGVEDRGRFSYSFPRWAIYMKPTNGRIIILLATFLIGVLLVYMVVGIVVPVTGGDPYANADRCWH